MSGARRRIGASLPRASSVALLVAVMASSAVAAQGVGDASWTPSNSTTEARSAGFLVPDDAFHYVTEAAWDRDQVEGLATYAAEGLRYTHEVNDRSGRLSATGYWATNLPDPAFDRDDDDGDGRWEEAEVTSGSGLPEAGATYTTILEFSRWHGKRVGGRCQWAWDRRRGASEVLSQLSRDLLGEWQALRYTLAYEVLPFERVEGRPDVPGDAPAARCGERQPRASQTGVVVTLREPARWSELLRLQDLGNGRWTAFEAIGRRRGDGRVWTCGGPVRQELRLSACRRMGVRPSGVSAAVGYFDGAALQALRDDPAVARVDELRDSVTGLLLDVGGFGVEPPDLTVNDAYWETFLAD